MLNIIISIISVVIALGALFLSIFEIRRNNRQFMFDKRLKSYNEAKALYKTTGECYKLKNHIFATLEEGPDPSMDYIFQIICNNKYLEMLQPVIKEVLESDPQRLYLLKMSELEELGEEAKFIFSKEISGELSKFILNVRKCLMDIYVYMCAIKSMKNEQTKVSTKEIEKRKEMSDSLKELFSSFENVGEMQIFNSIEKSLKL